MLPRTTATGPFPIQHAFVVQFAAETRLDARGITGRVEHLVSGQATTFESVQALFTFMAARLREVQQTSPEEESEERSMQDQNDRKGESMSTTVTPVPEVHSDRSDALVTRLFEANLATYDLATIYLGDRLGLYTALHESGPMTAAQLAAHTGTHERYIREWLEQQTVSGILRGGGGARRRRGAAV